LDCEFKLASYVYNDTMASSSSPLNLDRKQTRSSHSVSSHGMSSNVVDHLAPGVTENPTVLNNNTVPRVRAGHEGKIITVQPLKKDEMQVS
jgi:hypothetical protein